MTPRPLRVLWITTSLSWDGPGRALAALLRAWPADDAIAVCALKFAEDAFREAAPSGVRIEALGMRSLFDAGAMSRLAALCRAWQPDVIHTQLSRADWLGRCLGWRLGVPVVSTIQNVHSRMYAAEFPWLVTRAALALDRMTGRHVTRFVAVSEGVKADLVASGVSRERIAVIPNPFDSSRVEATAHLTADRRHAARHAWGVGDADVVVGTVGLLKEQKGVRDLIAAAGLVAAARLGVRFVHVGGGPLETETRRAIIAAALTDRFRLVGWVADPLTLLPGMDVFVLPSLWEGLPIALLEAMAAGLPAVGTRVAGIEEAIVDGTTGYLVPAGDPAALAAALIDLVDAPARRVAMGNAGRARLAIFAAGPLAADTRQVYLDVLGPRSGDPR